MSINEQSTTPADHATPSPPETRLPGGRALKRNIRRRKLVGQMWHGLFIAALVIAVVALLSLLYNIVNESFGLVAVVNRVNPATLSPDKPFEELNEAELGAILAERMERNNLRTVMAETVLGMDNTAFREVARDPVRTVLAGKPYPPEVADEMVAGLDVEVYAQIMIDNLSQEQMRQVVIDKVIQPEVVKTWKLVPSLTQRAEIEAQVAQIEADQQAAFREEHTGEDIDPANLPEASLAFRSWVTEDFVTDRNYNSRPELTGIRSALLGSMLMILVTAGFAFPIGVGAAIYLEEYAGDNMLNRLIKVNISNLAGVPSIVYGMLGLVIFVRTFGDLTNGATVVSGGLTLGLLILPVIIINAQEAIRAVPGSIRQASYGLGATKWQTVWNHVLPNAVPGIMTGTILAMSRALGETAPLIVVGAATRITKDPTFTSQFTALPIQIYRMTSNPEGAFRNVAAAAIIVLLALLLTMNATAILLRNRYSRRF